MSLRAVWLRLLWKEMRESWTIVGICLALPLVLMPLCRRVDEGFRSVLLYMGLVICALLIALWAVDRVHNRGLVRAKSRTQLPVPLPLRWMATFVLPLPIPVLTGSVLAVMLHMYDAKVPFAYFLTVLVLGMMSLFWLTTALTTLITPIPAVLVGTGWAMVIVYYLGEDMWQTPNHALFVRAGLAALLASLVWEFFARRFRYLPGRLVAMFALLAIILGPTSLFSDLNTMVAQARSNQDSGGGIGYYETPDHAVLLQEENGENRQTKVWENRLAYHDRRTDIYKSRVMQEYFTPLGIVRETRVLLMQQQPAERALHLLEWETRSDQVREIMHLPAQQGDIFRLRYTNADPQGRYLLLGFRSRRNTGSDLWLIDLAQKRATLVLTGIQHLEWFNSDANSCTWLPDHALLTSYSGTVRVDLATMRAAYVDFTYPTR